MICSGQIESVSDADRVSQPKGKWIMPGIRFTEFPALSVDPRVGIIFLIYDIKNHYHSSFLLFLTVYVA